MIAALELMISLPEKPLALNNTTPHNTTPHHATQHHTTQRNATQHNTTLHSTAQHSTAQHRTAPHRTAQHRTAQHHATPRHATPCHNTQHTTHNTQHTTHNTQHTTHNTQHTTHNTAPSPEGTMLQDVFDVLTVRPVSQIPTCRKPAFVRCIEASWRPTATNPNVDTPNAHVLSNTTATKFFLRVFTNQPAVLVCSKKC